MLLIVALHYVATSVCNINGLEPSLKAEANKLKLVVVLLSLSFSVRTRFCLAYSRWLHGLYFLYFFLLFGPISLSFAVFGSSTFLWNAIANITFKVQCTSFQKKKKIQCTLNIQYYITKPNKVFIKQNKVMYFVRYKYLLLVQQKKNRLRVLSYKYTNVVKVFYF